MLRPALLYKYAGLLVVRASANLDMDMEAWADTPSLDLITAIVERGIANDSVEAAFQADAHSATLLLGRGTGVRQRLGIPTNQSYYLSGTWLAWKTIMVGGEPHRVPENPTHSAVAEPTAGNGKI